MVVHNQQRKKYITCRKVIELAEISRVKIKLEVVAARMGDPVKVIGRVDFIEQYQHVLT